MAGGSRIVISDDGITISTGGKIIYRAGQHKFEGGQKVVSPMTVLPTVPNDYSRKFFIPTSVESAESNIKVGTPTHILGLKADDHEPIFFEKLTQIAQRKVSKPIVFIQISQPMPLFIYLLICL